MLAESRISMAIKRNALRDTFSDDLEYAYCIKNEHEEFKKLRNEKAVKLNIKETRSLESTPERKTSTFGD